MSSRLWFFHWSCIDVRVGQQRKLSAEELMLWNCSVGEDSQESPGCKENKPVNPKGNQPWIFMGRIEAEAQAPLLWPPDVMSLIIGKDPDSGKDWGQEEKGMTEDEMVGWLHWHNGHGFGWTLGVGDGQGGLVCCGSWGHKESDTTEWLHWTELRMEIGIGSESLGFFLKMCACVSQVLCLW